MFASKSVNIFLLVGIVVASVISLLLAVFAYSCIRKKLSGNTAPERRLRVLRNICCAFIPIDIVALLFSITSLITLFAFMNTDYYSLRGFEGEYYPGGITFVIVPVVISLLGLFFCVMAYVKSASVLVDDKPLIETQEQKKLR